MGNDREVADHLSGVTQPEIDARSAASVGVESRANKPVVEIRVATAKRVNRVFVGDPLETVQISASRLAVGSLRGTGKGIDDLAWFIESGEKLIEELRWHDSLSEPPVYRLA